MRDERLCAGQSGTDDDGRLHLRFITSRLAHLAFIVLSALVMIGVAACASQQTSRPTVSESVTAEEVSEESEAVSDEPESEELFVGIEFDPSLPQGADSFEASREMWTGDEWGFYHAQLNERERFMYEQYYEHLINHETDFLLGTYGQLAKSGEGVYALTGDELDEEATLISDEIYNAQAAVYYDHPEIFWVTPLRKPEDVDAVSEGVIMRLKLAYSEEEIAARQEAMDQTIAECLKTVDKDASDYEQALAVYEWIRTHVSYTEDPLANSPTQFQTADTALVDRLSICSGMARGYQIILNRLGICSTVVRVTFYKEDGSVDESMLPHMYNLVCLGGRYAYSDTTPSLESKGEVNYLNFCRTDAMLKDSSIAWTNDSGEKVYALPTPDLAVELPACDQRLFVRIRNAPRDESD